MYEAGVRLLRVCSFYSGQELFSDAGFASIGEALKSATDSEGDLAGFEVSYGGYVVGTYRLEVLRTNAEKSPQRAVDTASSLRWQ